MDNFPAKNQIFLVFVKEAKFQDRYLKHLINQSIEKLKTLYMPEEVFNFVEKQMVTEWRENQESDLLCLRNVLCEAQSMEKNNFVKLKIYKN